MLSNKQLKDAVAQAYFFTENLVYNYEHGIDEYKMVSLREVLYELGYTEQDADQIIKYVAAEGFHYCVDPIIKHEGVAPTYGVCVWGVDQLFSRLSCIR